MFRADFGHIYDAQHISNNIGCFAFAGT